MRLRCVENEDKALRLVAEGAWEVWRRARQSSGLYLDHVDLIGSGVSRTVHIGVTGLGMIAECVAVSLGLQDPAVASTRVAETLSALLSHTPVVQVGCERSVKIK